MIWFTRPTLAGTKNEKLTIAMASCWLRMEWIGIGLLLFILDSVPHGFMPSVGGLRFTATDFFLLMDFVIGRDTFARCSSLSSLFLPRVSS